MGLATGGSNSIVTHGMVYIRTKHYVCDFELK